MFVFDHPHRCRYAFRVMYTAVICVYRRELRPCITIPMLPL